MKQTISKKVLELFSWQLDKLNETLKKQPADDGFFRIPLMGISDGGFFESIEGETQEEPKYSESAKLILKEELVFGKKIQYTIAIPYTELEICANNEEYLTTFFTNTLTIAVDNYIKQYGTPTGLVGRSYIKFARASEDNIFFDDGSGDALYIKLVGYLASNKKFK